MLCVLLPSVRRVVLHIVGVDYVFALAFSSLAKRKCFARLEFPPLLGPPSKSPTIRHTGSLYHKYY